MTIAQPAERKTRCKEDEEKEEKRSQFPQGLPEPKKWFMGNLVNTDSVIQLRTAKPNCTTFHVGLWTSSSSSSLSENHIWKGTGGLVRAGTGSQKARPEVIAGPSVG